MWNMEWSKYVFVPQEKLKLVTVLGAGLLCGTALAVIIPEGVHALYEEVLEGGSIYNTLSNDKSNYGKVTI